LKRTNRSVWLVLLIVAIGIIIGNMAGDAMSSVLPFFSKSIPIGMDDFSLKLYILDFHFGFLVKLNVMGLIGGVIGLLMVNR